LRATAVIGAGIACVQTGAGALSAKANPGLTRQPAPIDPKEEQ
jgi:hypothetical protein